MVWFFFFLLFFFLSPLESIQENFISFYSLHNNYTKGYVQAELEIP